MTSQQQQFTALFDSLPQPDREQTIAAVQSFVTLRRSFETIVGIFAREDEGQQSVIKHMFLVQIFQGFASMIFAEVLWNMFQDPVSDERGQGVNRIKFAQRRYILLTAGFKVISDKCTGPGQQVIRLHCRLGQDPFDVSVKGMMSYFSTYWSLFVSEWGPRDWNNIKAFLELNICPVLMSSPQIFKVQQALSIFLSITVRLPTVINGFNVVPSQSWVEAHSVVDIAYGRDEAESIQGATWIDMGAHMHQSRRHRQNLSFRVRRFLRMPSPMDSRARMVHSHRMISEQYIMEVPVSMLEDIQHMHCSVLAQIFLVGHGNSFFSFFNTTISRRYMQGRLRLLAIACCDLHPQCNISIPRVMSLILRSTGYNYQFHHIEGSPKDSSRGLSVTPLGGSPPFPLDVTREFDLLASFLLTWGQSRHYPWYPRTYLDQFQPQGEVASLPLIEVVANPICGCQPLTAWSIFVMRQMAGVQPYEDFSIGMAVSDEEFNNVFEDFDKKSRQWVDNEIIALEDYATQTIVDSSGSSTDTHRQEETKYSNSCDDRETNHTTASKSTSTSDVIANHNGEEKAATTSVNPHETLSFSVGPELESFRGDHAQGHSPSEVSHRHTEDSREGDHDSFTLTEMLSTLNEHHSHGNYIGPTHPSLEETAELDRLLNADSYGGITLKFTP